MGGELHLQVWWLRARPSFCEKGLRCQRQQENVAGVACQALVPADGDAGPGDGPVRTRPDKYNKVLNVSTFLTTPRSAFRVGSRLLSLFSYYTMRLLAPPPDTMLAASSSSLLRAASRVLLGRAPAALSSARSAGAFPLSWGAIGGSGGVHHRCTPLAMRPRQGGGCSGCECVCVAGGRKRVRSHTSLPHPL